MKVSGGISNLSFGFRGVTKIRESIHEVFLYHTIMDSGMYVGIVNCRELLSIDEDLICENLIFNKTLDATDVMLELTQYERRCISAQRKGLSIPPKPSFIK